MDFKAFYFGLPVAERDEFANRAHSSRGLLTQVAYRNKRVELGLADVLCALSGGQVSLDELPLTDNARRQRVVREGAGGASPQRKAVNTKGAPRVPLKRAA